MPIITPRHDALLQHRARHSTERPHLGLTKNGDHEWGYRCCGSTSAQRSRKSGRLLGARSLSYGVQLATGGQEKAEMQAFIAPASHTGAYGGARTRAAVSRAGSCVGPAASAARPRLRAAAAASHAAHGPHGSHAHLPQSGSEALQHLLRGRHPGQVVPSRWVLPL